MKEGAIKIQAMFRMYSRYCPLPLMMHSFCMRN
jgi:hypothetical protein